MIKRVPHYYKDFVCIASKCKDNCCMGGWQIDIDDETAGYYLGVKLGEEKLGVVCAQFPRYTEYFGNIKETGIGLACEEAERIIFSDKDSFHLECEEINEEECPDSEFDSQLANSLFTVRDRIFELMELTELSLHKKLVILIWLLHDIQTAVNSNNTEEIQRIAELTTADIKIHYGSYLNSDKLCKDASLCMPENVQSAMERVSYAYDSLELLNDEWENRRNLIMETLHEENGRGLNPQQYLSELTSFRQFLSDRERTYEYENLLKYFVFRYFLKAAYDHDVYGKAQLIVSNYFVILEMDLATWLSNGREFTFEDRIDTVHIFSREVEYSEDNICQLAEEFLFDEIFNPENLSALLLSLPC
jgi:lysine-N-methylase